MSSGGESHRGNGAVSASGLQAVTATPGKSGCEISGYEEVLKQHESIKKCIDPISENVQNKVWMSPDFLTCSNSEYVYAAFPIALSLFWDKGGGEICQSRPSSVIFYNTLALSKYNGCD